MADEGLTLSNITPAFFEKYIMSLTLEKSYVENGVESALISAPMKNFKVNYDPNDNTSIIEIRPPYVRRVPNETPMILDMIDSNKKTVLIEFQDRSQINALKLTPNPDSFVISSSKIINRYTTMTRWVEEHWGDEIDTINFSGSTYSFCAVVDNDRPVGLTVASRNTTEAYKYLKALVEIFKTNGYIYQEQNGYSGANNPTSEVNQEDYYKFNRFLLQNPSFQGNHPRHGMIRERLYNRISFDYVTLIGYFESFDIIEDSATPFRLIYSAVFKSEKTIWTIGT